MIFPWVRFGCFGSDGGHFLRVIKGLAMDTIHRLLSELNWERERVGQPFTNYFAWYYLAVGQDWCRDSSREVR